MVREFWTRTVSEHRTRAIAVIAAGVFVFVLPWALVWKKIWDYWVRLDLTENFMFVAFLVALVFALLEKFNTNKKH